MKKASYTLYRAKLAEGMSLDAVRDALAASQFSPIDRELNTASEGLVAYSAPLSGTVDPNDVFADPYLRVAARRDVIKVPPEAIVVEATKRAEAAGIEDEGELRALFDDVGVELRKRAAPKSTVVPIVHDDDMVFLRVFGPSWAADCLPPTIFETFRPLDWTALAREIDEDGVEGVSFGRSVVGRSHDVAEDELGREFLTWLVYESETNEATFTMADKQEPAVFTFASDKSVEMALNGTKIALRASAPSEQAEFRRCLTEGHVVTKLGFRMAIGQSEWTGKIRSDRLEISGLAVPVDVRDDDVPEDAAFEWRMTQYAMLDDVLVRLFRRFVTLRVSDEWDDVVDAIHGWIAEG